MSKKFLTYEEQINIKGHRAFEGLHIILSKEVIE